MACDTKPDGSRPGFDTTTRNESAERPTLPTNGAPNHAGRHARSKLAIASMTEPPVTGAGQDSALCHTLRDRLRLSDAHTAAVMIGTSSLGRTSSAATERGVLLWLPSSRCSQAACPGLADDRR